MMEIPDETFLDMHEKVSRLYDRLYKNGLLSDVQAVKQHMEDLRYDFAEYKQTREDTCPIRDRRRDGESRKIARLAILAAGVSALAVIANLILSLLGLL